MSKFLVATSASSTGAALSTADVPQPEPPVAGATATSPQPPAEERKHEDGDEDVVAVESIVCNEYVVPPMRRHVVARFASDFRGREKRT